MRLTSSYRMIHATRITYCDQDFNEWSSNYCAVGHHPQGILWAYQEGEIRTETALDEEGEERYHGGGDFGPTVWRYYMGRYDPESQKISIVRPAQHKHRELPDSLIFGLQRKFPKATDIVVF